MTRRLAAILAGFAASPAAFAADLHGAPVAPCGGEGAAPLVAWSPGTAAAGAVGACLTGEMARQPVVATEVDGEATRTYAALDHLWGAHLGGRYGFGRVGLGVDVPVWFASTADDVPNGVNLGDARVYVPITVLAPAAPGGVGVDAVVEGVAPTGGAAALLGGGWGAGGHVVVGARGERFAGNVDVGGGASAGATLPGLDTSAWLRLAVAGDWFIHPRFGVGAEAWLQVAPGAGAGIAAASPGEALLRVGAQLGHGLSVTAAGGTAITGGVGAASARGYLRLGYAGAPAQAATVKPVSGVGVAPAAPGPFDVLVSVRDEAGRPVNAHLAWEGAAPPPGEDCGADGAAQVRLAPGAWRLTVSAGGYGTQARELALAADRFRPETVSVVLLPAAGEASLRVGVEDPEGRRVDGALVTVDGRPVGATSSAGAVEVAGIAAGEHVLAVTQADFREHGAVPVAVALGTPADAKIILERPPGSVRVVTRGLAGPVPDARVRFAGPEDVPPVDIGATGERTFTLVPGHWTLVASAKDLGTQEREFEVEPGTTALVEIDVRMTRAEAGAARLVVRVVDPTGAPVEGAAVALDGQDVGRTANGGDLTLADLAPGERQLTVRAERFRDTAARPVTLGEGTREVTVPLAWRPGQLHLVVRGVEGGVLDARVRFEGPEPLPPADLGPDGEAWFELAPGAWTLDIASPTYGIQQRDVVVRADDVSRLDVVAGLLSADGDAGLALQVVDGTKGAVGGAFVTLDDHDVGATTAAGSLDIGGLAAGVHRLRVEAPGFGPVARDVTVKAAKTPVQVKLAALARPVAVTARSPEGPARDALVRAYGADVQPPAAVDDAGRRALRLEPGPWTLVAVSEKYGIAQRDLDVAPGTTPLAVDLQLTPPAADRGTLLVEVVDPAGHPVPGATLSVDGTSQTLGATGIDVLADRAPGPVKLAAAAPGYRPGATETVSVTAGVQTRRLRLEWLPRPVNVRVVNAAGAPVDAEVRVLGPGRTPPAATRGGVAGFSLLPGTWQVIASAPGYGPWRTEVAVEAGVAPVEVAAELAAEKVEVTRTSVVIREQVQFAFDKADIDPASHAVLGQVASTLLVHPEIRRIEVQGHSDTRGTEAYNQDLSQRRAEAVRAYLIGQGVEPGRIEAHGYGASRPIGDNATEAGRARNRRVQFEIVATEPGSAAPP